MASQAARRRRRVRRRLAINAARRELAGYRAHVSVPVPRQGWRLMSAWRDVSPWE